MPHSIHMNTVNANINKYFKELKIFFAERLIHNSN